MLLQKDLIKIGEWSLPAKWPRFAKHKSDYICSGPCIQMLISLSSWGFRTQEDLEQYGPNCNNNKKAVEASQLLQYLPVCGWIPGIVVGSMTRTLWHTRFADGFGRHRVVSDGRSGSRRLNGPWNDTKRIFITFVGFYFASFHSIHILKCWDWRE